MDKEMISKERINYTIDMLISMAVEEVSEETEKNSTEVLSDFICSKTGKALYDESTKLWCNGPSYIAELYLEEISKRWKVDKPIHISERQGWYEITIFWRTEYHLNLGPKETLESLVDLIKQKNTELKSGISIIQADVEIWYYS